MKQLFALLILAIATFICYPALADFADGWNASEKGDYATALREWKPLAEEGNEVAQYNIGVLYDNGYGVPQDYKEAIKWYRLSAEQGHASAQGNLGVMYHNGHGVLQDYIIAHMWMNLSAANGDEKAAENRDIVTKQMTTEQISRAQDLAGECLAKNYKGC